MYIILFLIILFHIIKIRIFQNRPMHLFFFFFGISMINCSRARTLDVNYTLVLNIYKTFLINFYDCKSLLNYLLFIFHNLLLL